jgi:tripartite-type tricarboxylate transporter receptor subunit TctC
MTLRSRRRFLHLAAGAAAMPAVSRIARAQAYPSRPVRIIVGAAAGGPTDFHARLIAQWLSERLGRSFLVENRLGASGNIGAEAVVRAPADGYTLLLLATSNTVNQSFYDKLSFHIVNDLAPVAGIARNGFAMVVTPSFPTKAVPEFIANAKANPAKINMASGGVGVAGHLCGELFKTMAGVDLLHVPYRGDFPALTDTISGQMQVMFTSLTTSLDYIRSGKLRALAVTTTTRSEALPNVPTMDEFLPGYEFFSFSGVAAPKNTPSEIVARLNNEINAGLVSPVIKARYADVGATTLASSPVEFGRLIAEQTEKFARLVRSTGTSRSDPPDGHSVAPVTPMMLQSK